MYAAHLNVLCCTNSHFSYRLTYLHGRLALVKHQLRQTRTHNRVCRTASVSAEWLTTQQAMTRLMEKIHATPRQHKSHPVQSNKQHVCQFTAFISNLLNISAKFHQNQSLSFRATPFQSWCVFYTQCK